MEDLISTQKHVYIYMFMHSSEQNNRFLLLLKSLQPVIVGSSDLSKHGVMRHSSLSCLYLIQISDKLIKTRKLRVNSNKYLQQILIKFSAA